MPLRLNFLLCTMDTVGPVSGVVAGATHVKRVAVLSTETRANKWCEVASLSTVKLTPNDF